jgi:hypothetical protein
MKKQLILFLFASFFVLQTYSQNYSIDIPNASLLYSQQKMDSWCWAACNQMLLSAKDIGESQENQCIKVFGSVINRGAGSNFELAKTGLGGTYINANGASVKIVPYVSYLSQRNSNDPLVIINHLNDGIPIIMATVQHGLVCVGVDYTKNGSFYQITKLRLLDPFYGSSIPVEYTMQQFLQQGLIGFMTFTVSNR